jgi:predicted aspartyl protease
MARHTMLALSWAWLFSCSNVWAQSNSVEHVVALKLYGQHLIVVQGSVGSLSKRNFVIDTGAYPSIIDRDLAKKLHVSGHAEELDAVDRTLTRPAVVVPWVDVGPIHVTAVRTLVDDLSAASERFGVRIDALIGLDVLSHSSFRIDYGTKQIFFGAVDPLPSSVPFEMADSMICVDLRAGGRPLRLLVDTGAEKVLLLGPRVSWLSAASRRTHEFTNLGGNFKLREISLEGLRLGDTSVAGQPIFVSDAPNMPAYRFDGFLSTAQFRQIAFDFERQRFSWMTNDSRRNQMRIAAHSPTSPAYVAAFEEGILKSRSTPAQEDRCGDQSAGTESCGTR